MAIIGHRATVAENALTIQVRHKRGKMAIGSKSPDTSRENTKGLKIEGYWDDGLVTIRFIINKQDASVSQRGSRHFNLLLGQRTPADMFNAKKSFSLHRNRRVG